MSAETLGARFTTAVGASTTAREHPNAARTSETTIERKVRLIEKAEAHFEKHRERWVSSRYQALLKKDSPAPSLKPTWGVEDRTTRLMRTACYLADKKQANRIRSIERASLHKLHLGREVGLNR